MSRLPLALAIVRDRLEELATSHDAVECKAEGLLEAARVNLAMAAGLLGEVIDEPDPAPTSGGAP